MMVLPAQTSLHDLAFSRAYFLCAAQFFAFPGLRKVGFESELQDFYELAELSKANIAEQFEQKPWTWDAFQPKFVASIWIRLSVEAAEEGDLEWVQQVLADATFELLTEGMSTCFLTPSCPGCFPIIPIHTIVARAFFTVGDFDSAQRLADWVAANGVLAKFRCEAHRLLGNLHVARGEPAHKVELELGRAIEASKECEIGLFELFAAQDLCEYMESTGQSGKGSKEQVEEARAKLSCSDERVDRCLASRQRF